MAIIGGILAVIGFIIMMIFGIIILIKAFKKSVLWGLGYIFVPFVSLVFVIMHWDECKSPFLKCMIGLVIYIIGFAMLAPSMAASAS